MSDESTYLVEAFELLLRDGCSMVKCLKNEENATACGFASAVSRRSSGDQSSGKPNPSGSGHSQEATRARLGFLTVDPKEVSHCRGPPERTGANRRGGRSTAAGASSVCVAAPTTATVAHHCAQNSPRTVRAEALGKPWPHFWSRSLSNRILGSAGLGRAWKYIILWFIFEFLELVMVISKGRQIDDN